MYKRNELSSLHGSVIHLNAKRPAFPYISWFILYVRIKSEFFVHTIWFVCTRYETHAGAFNYLLWAIKIIPKKPSRFSSSISMIRHNRRTWYWNISWCKSVEIILHLYSCLQNMKTKNRSNTCWEFKLYRLHELLRSQKKYKKPFGAIPTAGMDGNIL